ncbi:MAG: hypothetical protein A4E55_01829 [Pelotomaculum sp. PtaU1.Bin035]|nr:MAG: hypothetical protein A4E55_01829 [Pelotomaculum sp. PtaU1.Bin035]
MYDDEINNICSTLLDRITVAKGYLQLSTERKKVDYSLLLLQEISEIESLVCNIIGILKKHSKKP